MSTDPTAEHIDAVAEGMRIACSGPVIYRNDVARAILTSTDPAVHAALAAPLPAEVKIASLTDAEMLAALVDRGTLTEETEDIIGFHDETCPDPCPFGKRRRLATTWTPWGVAP